MVLFWDVDGTMIKNIKIDWMFFKVGQMLFGRKVVLDLPYNFGRGLTDYSYAERLIKMFGEQPTHELIQRMIDGYSRELLTYLSDYPPEVLPGVVPALEALRRSLHRSVLLTGNTRYNTEIKLDRSGLSQYFDLDKGGYASETCRDRIAVARYVSGLYPGEAQMVIGDTPRDIECAAAIGARSIAVATGAFSHDEMQGMGAWMVLKELPRPEEFLAILEMSA
jgi:phosphoglycolate phosphatase-like HAD superfamily hydrolase